MPIRDMDKEDDRRFFMNKKFKIGMICEAGFNTGTYYYTINTAEQLQALGHDVTMITPFNIKELKVKQKVYNPLLFKIPVVGRAMWLMSLYFRLHKSDFEVIESSWYGMMNFLPFDLYKKKLKVTTIFDVMWADKQFWKGNYYMPVVSNVLVPPHIRFNDMVITCSQFSKKEIVRIKGTPASKIGVAYYGVSDDFKRVTDRKLLEELKKKHKLPERFILNAGKIKNNKNILNILKAFNIVARKHPDVHLVFTGKLETSSKAPLDHKMVSEELKKMDAEARSKVLFLDYIPYDELRALYSLADIFLMPSLGEGFGLPVIEAMQAGVPVVTSNISCMPEVSGGAALLCDPYNPKDIASQLSKLLKDKALAKSMVSKGYARAKYFTWEKTARDSVKIYEQGWKKKFGK